MLCQLLFYDIFTQKTRLFVYHPYILGVHTHVLGCDSSMITKETIKLAEAAVNNVFEGLAQLKYFGQC